MRQRANLAVLMVGAGMSFIQSMPAQDVQPVAATDQVKDDLFAGSEKFAAGASNVSDVNLDQRTLGLVGAKGKNAEMAKKLDFVVVHSYTYDKPGMYKLSDLDSFRQKLTTGNWSCIVHEQTKTNSTDVCLRSGADHESNELVVIDAEPNELTFVHLKGRMSLEDLQNMKGMMGGPALATPPTIPLKPR